MSIMKILSWKTRIKNLLYLAAKLVPEDKLNKVTGAALQMQRELQWFKVKM
ncbi:hypothetical protein Hdeb2414_s0012g00391261 [Helianthus debilis subsp. tardiflorus]